MSVQRYVRKTIKRLESRITVVIRIFVLTEKEEKHIK